MEFARSAASFARAIFTKSAETQDLAAAREEMELFLARIHADADPQEVKQGFDDLSDEATALFEHSKEFYKNRALRAAIESNNADLAEMVIDELGSHFHGRIQYTRMMSHGEQVYACHSLLGHALDVGAEDVALMLMEHEEVTPAQAMVDTAQARGLTRAAAEITSRFECV
ncbi:MAG: hypothetical protein AB7E85_02035 [Pseudobdellovibrionaceae bacterium]